MRSTREAAQSVTIKSQGSRGISSRALPKLSNRHHNTEAEGGKVWQSKQVSTSFGRFSDSQ
jgi:hypothetical protein